MKLKILVVLAVVTSSLAVAQDRLGMKHSYVPPDGFVSNSTTALSIATAVLVPIYGAEKIRAEAPLVASLKDGVWTVVGTLSGGEYGGVAVIEISKQNGEILRVSHGK